MFYGVDNSFLSRALAADIFEPYASPALAGIPADLKLDASNRLLPVDFGFVALNYDKNYFADNNVPLPQNLRDLTKSPYKGLVVVENPATSSPGMAFLLTTIAAFGETGSYTYLDFWRDMRKNQVMVADGWEDAYYNQFSGGSGKGDHPLVVSYATSPAAEVQFADPKPTDAPTGNILSPGQTFRQVEFAGILKDTKNPIWPASGSTSCSASSSRPTSRCRCGSIRPAAARHCPMSSPNTRRCRSSPSHSPPRRSRRGERRG